MKVLVLAVFLQSVFIGFSAAAEEAQVETYPPIIRISFEWVEMSSESATKLTRTPRTTSNDNDLLATSMNPHDEDGQPDRSRRLILFVRAEVLKVSD